MRVRPRAALRFGAFATAAMLAAGSGDAAPTAAPVRHGRVVEPAPPRPLAPGAAARASAWATTLPVVEVKYRNTGAHGKIKLYAADGGIDRAALRSFMRICASKENMPDNANGEVAEPLDPRLVQLVMR